MVFISAACCIYYYLLPNGNISETAKRLLSVFFLAGVLSPLFSVFDAVESFSFVPGVTEEAQLADAAFDPIIAAAEAAIRSAVDSMIRAETDAPYEIRLSVHITETGGIDIKRLTVCFEREFAGWEKLTAALREAFGEAVETEVCNAVEESTCDAGAAAER